MKAMKITSWSLAGLCVLFSLISLIGIGVNYANYGFDSAMIVMFVRNILYFVWDTAVLILMLLYVYAQKRAMGYIAVGMMLTTLAISFVQSLISQIQYAQYGGVAAILSIVLWVFTEGLTFAFWVLWLFAPKSKPMTITVFILGIANILIMLLDILQWIPYINFSFILSVADRVCYFLSLTLAALWLLLRKKEAIPAGGEEAICEGVE